MDFCTNLTSKFWTNQEISFWQQFWFLDPLEIWFPRFSVHFWTQRPLGRSALAPGLMFDIRLCGKPMENPGKLKKLSTRAGAAANTALLAFFGGGIRSFPGRKYFWLNHRRPKFPIVEFSLKGREARFFMSGIFPPEIVIITLNELLFKLSFQSQTFQSAKFYGRIFPTDKDQIFWGLLCGRVKELLWEPFQNSSEAALLSKYQTFSCEL